MEPEWDDHALHVLVAAFWTMGHPEWRYPPVCDDILPQRFRDNPPRYLDAVLPT